MSVAPLARTSRSSSGRSRLASSRMSMPSSVRAGPSERPGGALPAHDRRRVHRAAAPVGPRRRVAVDEALPCRAVEIDRRAGRDRRRRLGDADHRRDAERARQDRGVRGPAAAFGDEAGGARPVDLRDRRRRELVGDEHPRLRSLRARRCRAIPSAGCRRGARRRRARRRAAPAGTASPAAPMTATSSSDAARSAHSAFRRSSRTNAAARPTSIASSIISSCASNSEAAPCPATPASLARIASSWRRDRPCASVRRDSSARTRSAATR